MVYIVNLNRHDYSSAREYGELKIILKQRKVNIFNTENIRKEMKRKLKKFNPKKDFLLVSGYSVLIMMASVIIYKMYGSVPILLWDAKENKYIPKVLQ